MTPDQVSDIFKKAALQVGFDYVGFAPASELTEEAKKLEAWLNKDYHGDMSWIADHFDLRIDPRKLMPGAKSVVSLMLNYFPKEERDDKSFKISKYAYGKDYHRVIRRMCKKMLASCTDEIGQFASRICVDSAPAMDRAWAEKSGLGWVGKNANLISKKSGSFFFLAEIIVDLDMVYDTPIRDYCGTCTRCIDACPTGAIEQAGEINSNKCISYLTIEYKKSLPEGIKESMDQWAFGCDVCQDVCPWNRLSKPHSTRRFNPLPGLLDLKKEDILQMTEEAFNQFFEGSAIRRTKYEGMVRNVSNLG